jgi:hypothetical protein
MSTRPQETWLSVGDSKSSVGDWQAMLATAYNAAQTSVHVNWNIQAAGYKNGLGMLAKGGMRTETLADRINADLAVMPNESSDFTVRRILVNMSINDAAPPMLAEADWKTDAAYILDAFHAKYPSASVYLMRFWGRNLGTNCNTLATWQATVQTARSTWCFLGPDERVWLEGGDDGVTMTTDGLHYSAAGKAEAVDQWMEVLT